MPSAMYGHGRTKPVVVTLARWRILRAAKVQRGTSGKDGFMLMSRPATCCGRHRPSCKKLRLPNARRIMKTANGRMYACLTILGSRKSSPGLGIAHVDTCRTERLGTGFVSHSLRRCRIDPSGLISTAHTEMHTSGSTVSSLENIYLGIPHTDLKSGLDQITTRRTCTLEMDVVTSLRCFWTILTRKDGGTMVGGSTGMCGSTRQAPPTLRLLEFTCLRRWICPQSKSLNGVG
mmetsp:Transcript_31169/g.76038  ORF Transcript_31169/g.76038 Transcript_31169/m.76038 type:complete len:233 (-) Transcript_31169:2046-2744(-)